MTSGGARRIVLATHNAHKVEEFGAIVAAVRPDLEVVGYDGPEPVEDGVTFAQNALIKARAAAARTGLPALADDSGICVDVLGGAPGVFSAYWAGHAKDAGANLALLLDQLSDIADPHRTARFVSTIALVLPSGASMSSRGVAGAPRDGCGRGGRFRLRPDLHPRRSTRGRRAHGRPLLRRGEERAVAPRARLPCAVSAPHRPLTRLAPALRR